MRVVQLITQDRGGPVDHAVDVAVELVRRGHRSHLVGPPGEYAAAAAAQGVEVHVAEVRTKGDLAGARRTARIVSDLVPDVVHCQDRRAGLVGRVEGWRSGVPTVYTLHGVPDPLAPLVPGNLSIAPPSYRARVDNLVLERWLSRAPRSMVVTPCDAVARYARDHVGIRPDRVRAVHNGVQGRWLEDSAAADVPDRVGVRPALTLAWLGVMQPVKRVADLVRVIGDLPDVELLLIGDGPQRPLIEAAAARHAPGRVRFAGFHADPEPLLRTVDAFVLPSAAEACPMALLQAMAIGLPVIATRVGGVAEVVRDGVDGLLVDAGADEQLSAAIHGLADDPALRRRLGRSGRTRVADRFTIHRCVNDLLEVYAAVHEGDTP